ncbi:aldehyde dehydrogenase family protein [Ornithinimicrobium sp. F0845]|uniref:aldehyde dehydrogenase family protein n=1 Tax=Ornithinimicrobium sp. F0845 TaxID=2926412 RepID=UPI001FF53D77|nr:aldehyde dehydrogenase family protein [Ornithinimicrobium sp. F0845]MCK0110595.1 aldehyde dehydrogenase family protein [Ornithinimicrobium sp. F0845]
MSTEYAVRPADPSVTDGGGRPAVHVDEAVALARETQAWWSSIGFAGRRHLLDRWREDIVEHLDELAAVVRRETGKPHGDAVLEIGLAVEHLAWAAKHASRTLGRRRVGSTLLAVHLSATVEYLPFGVIGVIGPWNYPVFTPMGSIGYALAGGNAVVFKPSELTPQTGQWLVDSFERAVGRPVLLAVQGGAEVGDALCRSGVDKVGFTGSTRTAQKVMATCAETLTPVLIEGGGKDALIVDADADVAAAALAAVWGGVSNAGQTCIGVERVLAHEAVYDELVAAICREASHLRAGTDEDADLGPITLPKQLGIIRDQVTEAVAAGARAVVGGEQAAVGGEQAVVRGEQAGQDAPRGPQVPDDAPISDPARVIQPVVLVDTPTGARIQSEETFGPVITVDRVSDMDEAVAVANAVPYGLGGAVYSRRNGPEIARRVRSGMTSVNNVVGFAGLPALPFGGVGGSGFGRIHGEDGLREFCYAKSVARQRFTPPVSMTNFERRARVDGIFRTALTLVHGKRPWRA